MKEQWQVQEPCEYAPFTIDELKDEDMQKLLREFKNQQVEDTISRQAVLDIVRFENRWLLDAGSHNYDTDIAFESIISKISDLPPINPQPKAGHWSRKTKVDGVYDIAGVKTWGIKCQCDRCDFTTTVIEDFGYYKYCPNCGTKMVEQQESEDRMSKETTCENCINANACIMYEPKMKRCKDYKESEVQDA